jgi:hypothetical protein
MFEESLCRLYRDPNLQDAAVLTIEVTVQTTTVAEYTARFDTHAPCTKWNDEALKHRFYKSLDETIKDKVRVDGFITLNDLQCKAGIHGT